jgi:hypothetical protein
MNVQTDLRAGWDSCCKCGYEIKCEVDLWCWDFDVCFGWRKKHSKC